LADYGGCRRGTKLQDVKGRRLGKGKKKKTTSGGKKTKESRRRGRKHKEKRKWGTADGHDQTPFA